jgi:hypothetical protein
MFGNPGIWICAFVAAGTIASWPFALILIKPTFAPLAFLGIRRRSWWVAAAVLAGVSVLFLPLWLDWVTALRNSDVTLIYNLPSLPLMVAPLIPWLADDRHPIHGWLRRRRPVRWGAPIAEEALGGTGLVPSGSPGGGSRLVESAPE